MDNSGRGWWCTTHRHGHYFYLSQLASATDPKVRNVTRLKAGITVRAGQRRDLKGIYRHDNVARLELSLAWAPGAKTPNPRCTVEANPAVLPPRAAVNLAVLALEAVAFVAMLGGSLGATERSAR